MSILLHELAVIKRHTRLMARWIFNPSKGQEDGLDCHQLVMIAAEQIFVILEEGFDVPANGQDVNQSLRLPVEHLCCPSSEQISRVHPGLCGFRNYSFFCSPNKRFIARETIPGFSSRFNIFAIGKSEAIS